MMLRAFIAPLVLAALLSGCGPSITAVQTGYQLPPAPSHLARAGRTTPIPKGPLDVVRTRELLADVRRSEVANARANKQWRSFYHDVKRRAEGPTQ